MPVTSGCSYLREWRVVNSSVRSPLDPRRLWCRGVLASQTGRAFSFAEARLAVIDRAVPLSVARKLDWRPLSWRIVAHRGTSWHMGRGLSRASGKILDGPTTRVGGGACAARSISEASAANGILWKSLLTARSPWHHGSKSRSSQWALYCRPSETNSETTSKYRRVDIEWRVRRVERVQKQRRPDFESEARTESA